MYNLLKNNKFIKNATLQLPKTKYQLHKNDQLYHQEFQVQCNLEFHRLFLFNLIKFILYLFSSPSNSNLVANPKSPILISIFSLKKRFPNFKSLEEELKSIFNK